MSVPEELTRELTWTTSNSNEHGQKPSQTTDQQTPGKDEEVQDPNLIDWDGPNDPQNPLNWSSFSRNIHVVLVSVFCLTANLASTMFAPGAAALCKEFNVTNSTLAAFTVTIYVLGFAVGPLFVAPLSELYGRRIIYHVCNVIFLAFTLGCAASTDAPMFFVFRFICGCAASAPMTIGGGTIADVVPREKRGVAMAIFATGPLLGPVIGPIVGGFVTQSLSWRWTFWIMAIMSGTFSIIGLLMRETNATVLLNHKAARLRKETGNPNLVSKTDLRQKPGELLLHAVQRPTKLLIFSPIVLFLSLYCALVFGLIFLLFTTFPAVFEDQYSFTAGTSGLAYLGLGIGMFIGITLFALLSDKLVGKTGLAKPEDRLTVMVWFSPLIPIGFFWYGWSTQEKTHWIVPILGTSLVGFGSLFVIMPAQIYLVDAFGAEGAASALAALTTVRTLFATFLALAGPPMYGSLGYGWGNSLLGFLCLAFSPVPLLFLRYGEWLREHFVINF